MIPPPVYSSPLHYPKEYAQSSSELAHEYSKYNHVSCCGSVSISVVTSLRALMAVSYLLSDTSHRALDEFSHRRNDVLQLLSVALERELLVSLLQVASPWVSVHVEISGGTNVAEIVSVGAGDHQLASGHLSGHLEVSKVGFTVNDGHLSDTGEFCSC